MLGSIMGTMPWLLTSALALAAIGALLVLMLVGQKRNRRRDRQLAKSLMEAIQAEGI